jgi:outer membrane protein insertion porin family
VRYRLIPVIAAFLILSAFQRGSAQANTETSSATGKIAEITVTGNNKFPADQIIAASKLSPGDVVGVVQLQAAANRLAALGVFNAVNYRYWSKGDSINVEFQVQPARMVPLSFDNFPWFSDEEIAAAIRQQVGMFDGEAPEGGTLLDQINAALEKLLSSRHLGGIVVHQLLAKPVGNGMMMQYQVQGPPLLVQSVEFGDPLAANSERLKDRVPDVKGRPYSRYALEVFENEQLRPLYFQNGYLHVRIGEAQSRLVENKEDSGEPGVAVVIPIVPGPAYTWDEAVWRGNQVVPSSTLDALLGLKPGDVADGLKIEAGWQQVQAQYGTHGYLDVKLDPRPQFDDAAHRISFEINVTEGPQYRMGDMVITGLSLDAETLLRHAWQLAPGQIFDQSYFDRMLTLLAKPNREIFHNLPVHYAEFGHWLRQNKDRHTVDVLLDFK